MNSTSVANSKCTDKVASALLVITKHRNTAKVVETITTENKDDVEKQ